MDSVRSIWIVYVCIDTKYPFWEGFPLGFWVSTSRLNTLGRRFVRDLPTSWQAFAHPFVGEQLCVALGRCAF